MTDVFLPSESLMVCLPLLHAHDSNTIYTSPIWHRIKSFFVPLLFMGFLVNNQQSSSHGGSLSSTQGFKSWGVIWLRESFPRQSYGWWLSRSSWSSCNRENVKIRGSYVLHCLFNNTTLKCWSFSESGKSQTFLGGSTSVISGFVFSLFYRGWLKSKRSSITF